MPFGAKILSPLLVTLALLLAAGLLGGQAHAHGLGAQGAQGAHAAQPAPVPADPHSQTPTGHTTPHCHTGAICAPAIEAQAGTALTGPDLRATHLRSDHAAPFAVSHTPVADPPPPRM